MGYILWYVLAAIACESSSGFILYNNEDKDRKDNN